MTPACEMPSADGVPDALPLRVCMLAACPFPANHGTPGSIREMAEAVAERGHEVHIVTYHIGEDIPLRGPRLHRIKPLTREKEVVVGPTVRRPLYDLQMVFKTRQVLRLVRPHVVHAHGYEAALAGWLARLGTGVPLAYSGHNTMADELPSFRFIRPRWLAAAVGKLLDAVVPRLADRCLPHSDNLDRFFRGMGLGPRVEPVVHFGIDVDGARPGDGRAARERLGLNGGPVVLYSGVLDEFQRLDLLLGAMQHVAASEPGARLLVVVTIPNPAHERLLRARAARLGLAERVVLTEPQPLAAIPDLLAACDVAVVPRPATPGFPIKLLNYMAARRACVLFASSAGRGLVHRQNAFLAAPDTAEALGEGLLEVARDADLRRRLADGGHGYVRANHDRRLVAEQLVAVYRRLLACQKSPAVAPAPRVSLTGFPPPWPAAASPEVLKHASA